MPFFFFLTIKNKRSKDQDMETCMGSSGPLAQTPRRHRREVWGLKQRPPRGPLRDVPFDGPYLRGNRDYEAKMVQAGPQGTLHQQPAWLVGSEHGERTLAGLDRLQPSGVLGTLSISAAFPESGTLPGSRNEPRGQEEAHPDQACHHAGNIRALRPSVGLTPTDTSKHRIIPHP